MSGRRRFTICTILCFLAIIPENVYGKLPWGSPCRNHKECQEEDSLNNLGSFSFDLSLILTRDTYSECRGGRCKCSNFNQHLQFKNNNYVCKTHNFLGSDNSKCSADDPETCVNGVCESPTLSIMGDQCYCNDGYVFDGNRCRETVTVDYSAYCISEREPLPICNYDKYMMCNSGKCECYKSYYYDVKNSTCISRDAYIKKYPEETVASFNEICHTPSDGLPKICDETANLKCESNKCKCPTSYVYDVENNTCISRDAYIKKYPEETKASLDEFCGTNSDGFPKICDETANMKCESKKCKCTRDFYPSYSLSFGENKTCESKASYAKENNLTDGYKVMPGVYCDDSNDCIAGLTCASKKCACPHPCKYNNMTVTCDCGAVSSMEGAAWPILVGIIGGIVIIVFWFRMIRKTIEKKSINTKDYDDAANTEPLSSTPLTEPYRIQSTNTSDYSTTVPVSNPPYPVSPVPKREPSPVPPYSLSAPGDPSAPVGFSAPTAPPPDAAQQPPPYISNPAPYPTNPAQYTSNPNPYPISPATVPELPGTVNTGPGYTISPDSGQTMENPTNPTANAPPPYSFNPPSAPPAVDIYKPII